MTKVWLTSEFEVETCCNCGIAFAMPGDYANKKKKNHKTFHCPNGHPQHYTRQSDEEKLQVQLKHCRLDRDFWIEGHKKEQTKRKAVERSRSSLKGVITKMKGTVI